MKNEQVEYIGDSYGNESVVYPTIGHFVSACIRAGMGCPRLVWRNDAQAYCEETSPGNYEPILRPCSIDADGLTWEIDTDRWTFTTSALNGEDHRYIEEQAEPLPGESSVDALARALARWWHLHDDYDSSAVVTIKRGDDVLLQAQLATVSH